MQLTTENTKQKVTAVEIRKPDGTLANIYLPENLHCLFSAGSKPMPESMFKLVESDAIELGNCDQYDLYQGMIKNDRGAPLADWGIDAFFSGLNLLAVAVIFGRKNAMTMICKQQPDLLNKAFECPYDHPFNGFLPIHFAAFMGLGTAYTFLGMQMESFMDKVEKVDTGRTEREYYDTKKIFVNGDYTGFIPLEIAFHQGHKEFFIREVFTNKDNFSVARRDFSYHSGSSRGKYGHDYPKNKPFEVQQEQYVQQFRNDLNNVVSIAFKLSSMTRSISSRDHRLFIAGYLFHVMYPMFSLHECLEQIQPMVKSLSYSTERDLKDTLCDEILTRYGLKIGGISMEVKQEKRDVISRYYDTHVKLQPRKIGLFACKPLRTELVTDITNTEFTAAELEPLFSAFFNPSNKAKNMIAKTAIRRFMDEVSFTDLHLYNNSARAQKQELILSCLDEKLENGGALTPKVVKSIVDDLCETQFRRSEIMGVLDKHIRPEVNEEISAEQESRYQSIAEKSIEMGSLSQLTLLDTLKM